MANLELTFENKPFNKKSIRTKFKAPLVVTRNPRHPPFRDILQKHFHILQLSATMNKEIATPPKVIFRQPPNLRKLLVCSTLKNEVESHTHKGSFKLHERNCVTCYVLKETKVFKSETTGVTYKIFNSVTCTSTSVIYLINCLDCKKQYVGETGGELRQRHRGHRQEFKKGHTPLGKHFKGPCNNFELIGISTFPNFNKAQREQKELFWIHQLKTFHPTGINVKKVSKHN